MPKFTPDKLGFGQPNATGTSVSGNPGLSASGGSINDYQSPDGNFYRAHIFYGSGELTVTSAGKYGNNIEFLVVAGGGGGGSNTAPDMGPRAGGGAGGLRTNAAPTYPRNLPASAVAYPGSGSYAFNVTVGQGGWYGQDGGPDPATVLRGNGMKGNDSKIASPTADLVVATGGGGGTSYPAGSSTGWGDPAPTNLAGGSGGGGNYGSAAGTTVSSPDGLSPAGQGYNGGGPAPNGGGGGGGAGGEGGDNPTSHSGGKGGAGLQVIIAGGPTHAQVGAQGPGPTGLTYNWFAGGGGGGNGYPGGSNNANGFGGNKPAASVSTNSGFANFYNYAGAGDGADAPQGAPQPGAASDNYPIVAQSAYPFTGSGGGGGTGASSFGNIAWTKGGNGGPGICVMRYQIGAIGESPTAPTGQQAKATGGNISFYNGKAIHTFVNPDNFVTDAGFNETIEWVAVGGGGGGGGILDGPSCSDGAGGGGSGGFNTKSDPISTPTSTTYKVYVGRGGREVGPNFSGGLQGADGEASGVTFGGPAPDSEIGPIPGAYKAYGGGGGGSGGGPAAASTGRTGATGGGGGGTHPTAPTGVAGGSSSYPGSPVTQGYIGSASAQASAQGGGAGGGAGGAASHSNNYGGSNGGAGKQLPTTFRDPNQQIGAYESSPASWFWIGGGGGGGAGYQPQGPYGGKSSHGGGQGGGRSPTILNTYEQKRFTNDNYPYPQGTLPNSVASNGWAGQDSTGGGGGGACGSGSAYPCGGAPGGSGLVVIAYPV